MKFDPAAFANRVTVADGAWATRLMERGWPPSRPSELANLESPDVVLEAAHAYLDAGARVLTTNTFGANRLALDRRGSRADVGLVNRKGAALARQAAGDRAWVVGSIGPSGRMLLVKETTPEALTPVFTEQAEALAEGGVDALVLETFTELEELLVALAAVKAATKLPVIASMSFDSGPQRAQTSMGAAADQCATTLEQAGADLIGCNCGAGIATILPAVVALRGGTNKPLWVKPSAGLPDLVEGHPVYHVTPDEFIAHVPTLLEAGANIIGGCCGVGPEHIQRLAKLVGARRKR
jgi:methionine synthase I (cobalamin-dependent)